MSQYFMFLHFIFITCRDDAVLMHKKEGLLFVDFID
jgi:hypothetical protein